MPTLTTLQIRNYAWMSQASYLDLQQVTPGSLATRLQNDDFYPGSIFAEGQATTFTNATTGYSLANHQPDEASGFSATLFQGNAGGYTIAVRGTDPRNQILEDVFNADALGVVLSGAAKQQVFDAYRYYKQLTAAQGVPVFYTTQELTAMASLVTGKPNPALLAGSYYLGSDVGLGAVPAGATVNFTGHSLGGHVAALLAEMVGTFQGASKVGDLVTYNAPGTNALSNEIANWLGISTTVQSGVIGAKHLAIYGEGGLNVTAGLGQINGTRQASFIEDSGVLTGNLLVANHSMVKLSDVFAVKQVLATLMPSISNAQLDAILKAASNQFPNSLEKAVDGIRKVLGLSGSTVTEDRRSLYDNLKDLADRFAEPSGTLKSLAGKLTLTLPTTSLATTAKTDFAAFLSLNALSPVVISTTDAAAIAALKTANPTLSAAWTADSNARLYGDTSKVFDYSDNWYADRAAMLSAIATRNHEDASNLIAPNPSRGLVGGRQFRDLTSGTTLTVGTDVPTNQQIVFGSAGDETGASALNGGSQSDRLYGGAGNDTLIDSGALGTLQIDDQSLSGLMAATDRNEWKGKDAGGNTQVFTVLDDAHSARGKVLRITKQVDSANSITINHFDLNATLGSSGYLGIQLDPTKKLVTKEGVGTNLFADANSDPSSLAGQSSTLALSSLADKFKAILGDSVVAANGAVITLAEGQTQVSVEWIQPSSTWPDSASGSDIPVRDEAAMQFIVLRANPAGVGKRFDVRERVVNDPCWKVAA
jgi:hypothetical protein